MPEKRMSVPEFKRRLEDFKGKQTKGKKVWKTTLQRHIEGRLVIVQTHLKGLEQALQKSREFDKSTALKPKSATAFEKRMIVVKYTQKLTEMLERLKKYLANVKTKGILSRFELADYLKIEKALEDFNLKELLQNAILEKKANDEKVNTVLAKIKEIRERTRDHLKRPDDRVVVAILEQCAVLVKMGRLRTAIDSAMSLANEISNLEYLEFQKPLLFRIHDFFRWVRTNNKSKERAEFIDRYIVEVEKYLKQAGATSNDILVKSVRPIRPY